MPEVRPLTIIYKLTDQDEEQETTLYENAGRRNAEWKSEIMP